MAQIFKSKELTFSIPEKEGAEHPNCLGNTQLTTPVCITNCTCTVHTVTFCTCTVHTATICTCTAHTCICTNLTPRNCTYNTIPRISQECPMIVDPQDISDIKEVDTLEMLREKLSSALKDVEGKLKEAKGK
jgi:hypothetical protein